MKKIVNVKPKIADTYNQLADYVNNKETVIYIKYDSKVYSSKLSLDKKSIQNGFHFRLTFDFKNKIFFSLSSR